MGNKTKGILSICCISFWAIVSFIIWAGVVAAFAVYMSIAPFNQVAIGIWAATGAFVVTAVLLIISVFCLGLSGEKKSVIWGFLVAAFLFVCFLVLLAMSMVCIAVVFELPNGYQSNLEVVYLGSYSNSNQKVMVRAPSATSIVVQYSTDNATWLDASPNPGFPNISTDYVTVFNMNMLPGTLYYVRVNETFTNSFSLGAPFSFTTPVAPGDASNVTFAFGSCQFPFYGRGLPRWNDVAALNPDFVLFIGDFIYADVPRPVMPTDREWFQMLYRQILSKSEFQNNFIKWPSYFMFDDHEIFNDYNNATNTNLEIYSNAIQGAWQSYLGQGNPSPSPPYYFNFTVGQGSFFVLDTRSFRSQPLLSTSSMLGTTQRNDLLQWLSTDTSVFKFIVSTVTWTRNFPREDSWSGFPIERATILSHITTNNITGVTLLSGDDHTLGVYELLPGIYEFSASPVDGFGTITGHENEDPTICYTSGLANRHVGLVTYSTQGPNPFVAFNGYTNGGVDCQVRLNLINGTFVRS